MSLTCGIIGELPSYMLKMGNVFPTSSTEWQRYELFSTLSEPYNYSFLYFVYEGCCVDRNGGNGLKRRVIISWIQPSKRKYYSTNRYVLTMNKYQYII